MEPRLGDTGLHMETLQEPKILFIEKECQLLMGLLSLPVL